MSQTRYANGFGSQWRDLLDDAHEALVERGYQSCKLNPGGYKLPVVNDSLLYVWRVPSTPGAISSFASSPTRQSGFAAAPPDPMLFQPEVADESGTGEPSEGELQRVVSAARDVMPLVLVLVESSPRQLQTIDWAVATLDDTGAVTLHGREPIWVPEVVVDHAASDVDSFDAGTPTGVKLQPREQEGPQTHG